MPTFTDMKRATYRLHRSASMGATVTLVAGCGEYTALFECAERCAQVLGNRALEDMGDGLLENIPTFRIPIEGLYPTLLTLTKHFSVAIVDYVSNKDGGRFALLWRIAENVPETPAKPISTNLDDY